jgi:hypothetical protein
MALSRANHRRGVYARQELQVHWETILDFKLIHYRPADPFYLVTGFASGVSRRAAQVKLAASSVLPVPFQCAV